MQFDSSATAQKEVKRTLSLDPRMVRFSVVKVAEKMGKTAMMDGIEAVDGTIPWEPADPFQSLLGMIGGPGGTSKLGLR